MVGGGPAGLSCAHRLSMLGNDVVVFSRDEKLGGLNEYGIAAYKTIDEFAQREVNWILQIGGIEVRTGQSLGQEISLEELRRDFDAVFLGFGLGGVNSLRIDNEDAEGVVNAVEFIADLRQAPDKSKLPVGRRVVVIGGGMTAIDVGVQSKRLGSEQVDIVYRRGAAQMGASGFEQQLAQTNGVSLRHWSTPSAIETLDDGIRVVFERTRLAESGKLETTGERWSIDADVVFKAVGQTLDKATLGDAATDLEQQSGKLLVDADRRTSIDGIWAGGDCVYGHDDLTVSAVQDGKLAAESIHAHLNATRPANG